VILILGSAFGIAGCETGYCRCRRSTLGEGFRFREGAVQCATTHLGSARGFTCICGEEESGFYWEIRERSRRAVVVLRLSRYKWAMRTGSVSLISSASCLRCSTSSLLRMRYGPSYSCNVRPSSTCLQRTMHQAGTGVATTSLRILRLFLDSISHSSAAETSASRLTTSSFLNLVDESYTTGGSNTYSKLDNPKAARPVTVLCTKLWCSESGMLVSIG
jgi:hypothetical protein